MERAADAGVSGACQCSQFGFCERRNRVVGHKWWQYCQEGRGHIIDAVDAVTIEPLPQPKRRRTEYGARLSAILERETGEQVPCNECHSELGRMNAMAAEQIAAESREIAQRIVQRGAQQARAWYQRLACRVSPIMMQRRVVAWIHEAIAPLTDIAGARSDIRHLTYHVYPTKHQDGWRWNFEQLAARRSLFNGIRCLGVAVDGKTVDAGQVKAFAASCGLSFDHVIEVKNRRSIREGATWLPMLERLTPETASPNEVVFSAHAKGVRHDLMQDHITAWADLMYRACLDDWPAVESMLADNLFAGAFRRFGNFTTPGNHRWHYSGTFYWWRLAEIGRRKWKTVDQRFYGTESWPGHQARAEETGCLFHDNCGDLYSREYWEQTIWPEWAAKTKEQYATV